MVLGWLLFCFAGTVWEFVIYVCIKHASSNNMMRVLQIIPERGSSLCYTAGLTGLQGDFIKSIMQCNIIHNSIWNIIKRGRSDFVSLAYNLRW